MANTSSFPGSRAADPGDGWGPATPFGGAAAKPKPGARVPAPDVVRDRGGERAGGSARRGDARGDRREDPWAEPRGDAWRDPRQDDYWDQPDDRPSDLPPEQAAGSARDRLAAIMPGRYAERQRGLPAWGAMLVLLFIAGIGGTIDMISGTHVRGGFNIGIVVASIVAILVVRRSGMFPIVIAPPIVYSLASGISLYIRSGGLDDRKVLIDSAANWLVYGFPAIAAATAGVLIVAGVRMIIRK